MREGETTHPAPGESITCIRSGQSGGSFIFEVALAPGTGGPPTHTHDEGDEIIEVLEGEIVFRVNGTDQLLRAGDSLTLTPSDRHTFWNPSKTSSVRARVTHGSRFERLVAQPDVTSICMYSTYVDPGASRVSHPVMKVMMGLLARIGRLRGKRPVVDGERESAPAGTAGVAEGG